MAAGVSDAAEGLRLQTEIGTVENELAQIYADAGKRAKQLWRERRIVDADIDLLLRHTDELEAHLDELRQKSLGMQDPKAAPQCPQCKAEVAEGAKFCGNCGAKIEGNAER
jgi:hypothetical protein